MRHIDEDTITQAVIARHAEAPDERLRELMTSLVQHLHGFAREVRLTEAEWWAGIEFLTESGQFCSEQRQELRLLSDTLGLSTLVSALDRRKGCTEATVFGPSRTDQAPHLEPGADLAPDACGECCYVRGRVVTPDGAPIAGAAVDVEVWPADGAGRDDVQQYEPPQTSVRGALVSDADGRFHFRSVVPAPQPIPHDGPVGRMLRALGRHPWRPARLRFMISSPGYQRLVTDVFREGSKYLDSDAAFGVRNALVADWVRHGPGPAPDGSTSAVPFVTVDFDFVLARI